MNLNMKEIRQFLELPISKLIAGFVFLVVIGLGVGVVGLHNQVKTVQKQLQDCHDTKEEETKALEDELKAQLREIIDKQEAQLKEKQDMKATQEKNFQKVIKTKKQLESLKNELIN